MVTFSALLLLTSRLSLIKISIAFFTFVSSFSRVALVALLLTGRDTPSCFWMVTKARKICFVASLPA